jgi:hypothetical protein
VAGEAVAIAASALVGVITPSVEATVGAADFFAAAAGVDIGDEAVVCAGDEGAWHKTSCDMMQHMATRGATENFTRNQERREIDIKASMNGILSSDSPRHRN